MARDPIAGPDAGPESPFPIKLSGRIIKGFGRGSKDLGIPTANIPIDGLDVGGHTDIESGVYFGWAGLSRSHATDASGAIQPLGKEGALDKASHVAGKVADTLLGSSKDPGQGPRTHTGPDGCKVEVFPMVMSIGWNPFYKNKVRSVEVHIIHKFEEDFYNSLLNLSILGFIRPELDYTTLGALIDDIKTDIAVSGRSLERPPYAKEAKDPYLIDFEWAKKEVIDT
ncbi:hypothetical protein FH972_022978 [Carpinus fangiana]|uniref:riboflavin kinase n=1 Tax=Carpinus fangiana TaxID=176857 RepID=A0A5N6KW33_9ROSI|nr:hypothetical protein FH972_022978 [Carpinus fangiana]